MGESQSEPSAQLQQTTQLKPSAQIANPVPQAESWQGLPTLNILDGKIYYKNVDGNCLDIATDATAVVISGFACEEFIIYDGVVYYTVNSNQGQAAAMVKAVNLDGTEEREIFASGTSD